MDKVGGLDAVVEARESVNQGFGFRVGTDGDGEIGVPGESRFGSYGHREAADHRKRRRRPW